MKYHEADISEWRLSDCWSQGVLTIDGETAGSVEEQADGGVKAEALLGRPGERRPRVMVFPAEKKEHAQKWVEALAASDRASPGRE